MFNSSLRRVARSCQNASPVPSRPTTPTIASFTSNAHQRRHSSSKPPVPPNDGSSAVPAASVKQVGAPRSDTKRPSTESRLSKRKSSKDKADVKQEAQDDWTSKLPAVPSLQHLNPKDIYVASFFSTHRPLSITGPVPPETSIESIDKIFQPKPKSKARNSPQDVIYTLASAVETLDEHIANKQADPSTQSGEQKAAIIKALMQRNDNRVDPNRPHHLDGLPAGSSISVVGGNIKVVLQEIQRRFRPFNVPPVPTPTSDVEIDAAADEASRVEIEGGEKYEALLGREIEQQEHNPYIQQVVIDVPQDSDVQQGNFFTSHAAQLLEVENQDARIQDIARQPTHRRSIVGRRRTIVPRLPVMHAISVKRQRRLKMKKHKYKKLMRKTRNLRRKLGQL